LRIKEEKHKQQNYFIKKHLEKTYALSFPVKPAYLLSRAVFLRSAAYLALNSGYLKEAANLATLGLEKTPHCANQHQKNIVVFYKFVKKFNE
jgi:hypothetical protein